MGRIVALIVVAGLALAALYFSQAQPGQDYVSGIIEADEVRVGSRVGGRVAEIITHEGAVVAAGDVLLRFEPFDLNERLAEAEATLAARRAEADRLAAGYRPEQVAEATAKRDSAKAALDKLVAGLRPLEIQILADKLERAKADLARAETEYNRVKALYDRAEASRDEFDRVTQRLAAARATLAVARSELALGKEGTRVEEIAAARAKLAEAQAVLDLRKRGFRPEEIARAKAEVKAAEAAVAAIQRQIDELSVRAPTAGVVEAFDLQPGDLVAGGAPVMTLVVSGRLWVRAYVPENRLNIQVDQPAQIRVDAWPQRRFRGHVLFVARQGEFTPSNVQTPSERVKQVFRIKVQLDEGLDVLRPGMAADVFWEAGP